MRFYYLKLLYNFNNLDTTFEFGRECAKVVEPRGVTISREYTIPWKKQGLDIGELARMRFEENMGSRQICKLINAPRSTVICRISVICTRQFPECVPPSNS
jgi:hypothetical protein